MGRGKKISLLFWVLLFGLIPSTGPVHKKRTEMCRACSTYGGEERCIQVSDGET